MRCEKSTARGYGSIRFEAKGAALGLEAPERSPGRLVGRSPTSPSAPALSRGATKKVSSRKLCKAVARACASDGARTSAFRGVDRADRRPARTQKNGGV